jgi:hypothetical protein
VVTSRIRELEMEKSNCLYAMQSIQSQLHAVDLKNERIEALQVSHQKDRK